MVEPEEGVDPLARMEEGGYEEPPEVAVYQEDKQTTTSECPICYDVKGCIPLANCGHLFCEECLTSHVQHCMRNVPIPCPRAAEDCKKSLTMVEIQDLLSPEDFCEYKKTAQMQNDPTLIACPSCHEWTTRGYNRFVTCSECTHQFCHLHGNAHELTVKACKKMTRGTQDRQSKRTIRRHTKPCSSCHAPIEKNGGCDHIKCTACNTVMCWVCGTHTRMKSDGTCECESERESEREFRKKMLLVFCAVCLLPLIVGCACFYTLVAIALFVLSSGCCCCCCCGKPVRKRPDKPSLRGPLLGLWVASFWIILPWAILVDKSDGHGPYSYEVHYLTNLD